MHSSNMWVIALCLSCAAIGVYFGRSGGYKKGFKDGAEALGVILCRMNETGESVKDIEVAFSEKEG